MAIRIASNFKTGASQPLDEREVVEAYTDLANIDTAYEGLEVFVLENKKKYRYVDGEWIDISVVAGAEVTIEELNALKGVTTNIQEQLNKIVNNSSVSDVDVNSWKEFKDVVTEVNSTTSGDLRIHIRQNITVTDNAELDLSRCQIYGHYNRIINNGYTPKIKGNYAYFDTVYFQAANNGVKSDPIFEIIGSTYKSCQFIFNNCRFYNCLETGDNVGLEIHGASGASCHVIFITCTINGESSSTRNRTFLIKNNNSLCASLKVISLLYGNKGQETNKVGFCGVASQHDIFMADGSCEFVMPNSNCYKPNSFYQWGLNNGGASAVQSDWEQNDNSAPDFIKNKPTIRENFFTQDNLETLENPQLGMIAQHVGQSSEYTDGYIYKRGTELGLPNAITVGGVEYTKQNNSFYQLAIGKITDADGLIGSQAGQEYSFYYQLGTNGLWTTTDFEDFSIFQCTDFDNENSKLTIHTGNGDVDFAISNVVITNSEYTFKGSSINYYLYIFPIPSNDAHVALCSNYSIKPQYVEYQDIAAWQRINVQPVETFVKITYADLVKLRNSNNLVVGRWYRIIDYETIIKPESTIGYYKYVAKTDTTVSSYTRSLVNIKHISAGHVFDILVQAIDNNKLSENAFACTRQGDTYFTNENVKVTARPEAWKLKYKLDNDSYYSWCSPNGKGVIYSMEDGLGVRCLYDWKNIKFFREANCCSAIKNNDYFYTFSFIDKDNNIIDISNYALVEGHANKFCNIFIGCSHENYNGKTIDNIRCYDVGLSDNIIIASYDMNICEEHQTNDANRLFIDNDCVSNTICGSICAKILRYSSQNLIESNSNWQGNIISDFSIGNKIYSTKDFSQSTTNNFCNNIVRNCVGNIFDGKFINNTIDNCRDIKIISPEINRFNIISSSNVNINATTSITNVKAWNFKNINLSCKKLLHCDFMLVSDCDFSITKAIETSNFSNIKQSLFEVDGSISYCNVKNSFFDLTAKSVIGCTFLRFGASNSKNSIICNNLYYFDSQIQAYPIIINTPLANIARIKLDGSPIGSFKLEDAECTRISNLIIAAINSPDMIDLQIGKLLLLKPINRIDSMLYIGGTSGGSIIAKWDDDDGEVRKKLINDEWV